MTQETHKLDKRGTLRPLHHSRGFADAGDHTDAQYYTHRDTGRGLNTWGSPYRRLGLNDVRDCIPFMMRHSGSTG